MQDTFIIGALSNVYIQDRKICTFEKFKLKSKKVSF